MNKEEKIKKIKEKISKLQKELAELEGVQTLGTCGPGFRWSTQLGRCIPDPLD